MPDRTTFFVIVGVTFVLSIALLLAATRHGLWTEFWVSEAQIVVSAVVLLRLLRSQQS